MEQPKSSQPNPGLRLDGTPCITYLVASAEPVHGADLVRSECLAEEVDGRHLAAEHALLVHLRSGADVAPIERLENKFEFKLGL